MACSNGDVDDFVTCGVCYIEYNTEEKTPKFLQCSHTLCFQCLKKICQDGSITCPFCRNAFIKDVNSVPNNTYALHMLQQNQRKLEEAKKAKLNPFVVGWCFTCSGPEKPDCAPLGHCTTRMTENSIRDLDSLLSLKEDLLKLKDQKIDNLSKAIEKRLQIQEKLSVIMQCIKNAEKDVKQLQDGNNLCLVEMISVLEQINALNILHDGAKLEDEKKLVFLSELMDFVDDSSDEDTPETLKLKMIKSVELSQEKLDKATALSSEYDLQETMKTVIQLYDDKDRPIATGLENGFRLPPLMSAQIREELLLINHLITLFLRKQKSKQPAPVAAIATTSTAPTQDTLQRIPPLLANTNNLPIFILRLFRSNSQIGEVHIRPLPTFHPEFVKKLREFCFKSPKTFCSGTVKKSVKAIKNVFVSCAMAHLQFQANVPRMLNSNRSAATAQKVEEVGVMSIKNSAGKTPVVVGWSFFFPLDGSQRSNGGRHVKPMKVNELFGHVILHQMMEPLNNLSSLCTTERKDVTVTIESA